jgi:hypothetical protein
LIHYGTFSNAYGVTGTYFDIPVIISELGERSESFLADISTLSLYDPNAVYCDEALLDQVPSNLSISLYREHNIKLMK